MSKSGGRSEVKFGAIRVKSFIFCLDKHNIPAIIYSKIRKSLLLFHLFLLLEGGRIMYIKRHLEKTIREYLNKPEILAIIGPRQSGKTTLLKHIFKSLKKAVFVDFEDRDTLNLFNNDIKAFYNLHVKDARYLFIDEFQYAREGGQKLKFLYDTFQIKIIISGSSVLDLTHQAVKFLVGRIFIFHLYPLTFEEYIAFRHNDLYHSVFLETKRKIDNYLYHNTKKISRISDELIREIYQMYKEYAIFGGYPRVALAKKRDEKITVLRNIHNTYFLREIRDILQLSTEIELQKLIKALSLQIGSIARYNELSQLTSLNYASLIRHLNVLEKTFVVKIISPFCTNKRVEIAKAPKIYFWDNGVRNIAIDNFQSLDERIDRGHLNENFVAGELIKKEQNVNYWRTKAHAEIDFVLDKGDKKIVLEVKSTLNSRKVGKALISFIDKYQPYRIIVLSENFLCFDQNRDIAYLPIFFI